MVPACGYGRSVRITFGVRLRERHDARWQDDPHADDDRRMHTGVPGDPRGQEAREV
jgi:hypothetical protein